eukprot:CAMPEP_0196189590 /NCGR_PEP_ID=MMETSP0911-20130528/44577_1 /TAXON_ID=49265 /ORGANISM="Thalassiosira rotula, Strain GSO102" /LENGTH=61 /DNA_ID=CAMNT_0041461213 /DNA_START=49 /DNA_END=231 /DNA_ORIENTATION=-
MSLAKTLVVLPSFATVESSSSSSSLISSNREEAQDPMETLTDEERDLELGLALSKFDGGAT